MRPVKAACVSFRSITGDIAANLSRMKTYCADAAAAGACLVLFSELSLTGYSVKDAADIAISREDDSIKAMSRLASELDLTICFSFAETCEDRLYITACITDGDHELFYRKIHLGHDESAVYSPGDSIKAFKTDTAVYGISICVESHMPPLFDIYRRQGAEIMLLPYASGMSGSRCRANWAKVLPARANDNGTYVLACNMLKETTGGGICVLDPKGNVIDEYYGSEDHMLLCDLTGDLPRNHPDGDMRNISYYDRQRPDIYAKYKI